MSTLMFWNKQNNNSSNHLNNHSSSNNNNNNNNHNNNNSNNNNNNINQQQLNDTKNGKRNWLHAPDVLVNGHVAYLVKFLGSTQVDQPKGIEVVKEAIRRLEFTQQIKKSEAGSNVKTKKVEITVSIDGVAIQEPRSQTILHQFPLHKISYCADEKGVKKFFSFIAKTGNSTATTTTTPQSTLPNGTITIDSTTSSSTSINNLNNSLTNGLNGNSTLTTNGNSTTDTAEGHECFVFISNKLASDITLTIGQAFDLAYRRYMNDSGKFAELNKLQTQNKQLEQTVNVYRQRLKDLCDVVPKTEVDRLLMRLNIRDICDVPQQLENGIDSHMASINGSKTPDLGIDVSSPNNDDQLLIETSPKHFAPIVPPRNLQNQINSTLEALKPCVGTKLEGLLLNSDSDSDFDPRATECELQAATKQSLTNGTKMLTNDLFGSFETSSNTANNNKSTLGQQLFAPVIPQINGNNHSFANGTLTNGNGIMNGVNGITMNGNGGMPTSPPPLLAPPPKTSAPRRSLPQPPPTQSNDLILNGLNNGNGNNGNILMNGNHDLFGSTPFNPHLPTVFDMTTLTTTATTNVNPFTFINEQQQQQQQQQSSPSPPQQQQQSIIKSNPFGSPKRASNYDALKTINNNEFENFIIKNNNVVNDVVDHHHNNHHQLMLQQQQQLNNNNVAATTTTSTAATSTIAIEIFRDAAAAAFNEFKMTTSSHNMQQQSVGGGKHIINDDDCNININNLNNNNNNIYNYINDDDDGNDNDDNFDGIKIKLLPSSSTNDINLNNNISNINGSGGGSCIINNNNNNNKNSKKMHEFSNPGLMQLPNTIPSATTTSTSTSSSYNTNIINGFNNINNNNYKKNNNNDGKNNFSKGLGFDDFTLESLDPLRK